MQRSDGTAYIDIQTDLPSDAHPSSIASISSGSSVEEEDDAAPDWTESDDDEVQQSDHFLDGDVVDEDWGVEGEDWELADGDFTKHYNRLRQHYTATTSTATPLPARNLNAATRVATGRKVEKHDKDKSDRATQDQVLDSRTKLVLSALVNRGVIGRLERCISTGKEANVYLSGDRAVKIYRTSILNFRSRQAYIVGEHRFKGEYSSSKNPRKMVRVWAEKELRNLRRLKQGGVRVPEVYECKENVLVMEYLGGEQDAPRLKDADIDETAYKAVLESMRRMFQVCGLVHADLSEYNLLFHRGQPWVIDVSQSVERDHPGSLEFLRIDIRNVKGFFESRGVKVFSLRQMWDWITTDVVADLDTMEPDDSDDAVFMASFIPRSLNEVYDPERDAEVVKAGRGDELIYAGLTGLKDVLPQTPSTTKIGSKPGEDANTIMHPIHDDPASKAESEAVVKQGAQVHEAQSNSKEMVDEAISPDDMPNRLEKAGEDDKLEGDKREQTEEISSNVGDQPRQPRGHRHEDKDAKKERKKAVKEEQREKRQSKMSKSEKARLVKKTSRK